MKRLLIFFYFLNLISKIYAQITGSVTVNTPRGTVVGYHFDQGNDTTLTWYGQADVFLGIPFAVPPIGEFRYKVKLCENIKKHEILATSSNH